MKNGPYTLIVPPADYPGKRYRGRYAYEHIVVFWQTHGYVPSRGVVVHHKNELKTDNAPSNLEAKSNQSHVREHHALPSMTDLKCGWCGVGFSRRTKNYDQAAKLRSVFFCTRSCGAKHQHNR